MLTAAFPAFRQVARGNPFVWEGTLKPTEMTAAYKVRITYFRYPFGLPRG